MRVRVVLAAVLLALASLSGMTQARRTTAPSSRYPSPMQPFLKHLEPGDDGFPMEVGRKSLRAGSRSCRKRFASNAARSGGRTKGLLDPGFRGAGFCPPKDRLRARPRSTCRGRRTCRRRSTSTRAHLAAELRRLVQDLREVTVAEFLITAIDGDAASNLHTTVRYDIVGGGREVYRVEHVGEWNLNWRRNPAGWQVVRVDRHVASGEPGPASNLQRNHRVGARTQRLVPASTDHCARLRGWRRSTRC